MKVVVYSNRIIAALIKDSTTTQILFNKFFEFIAPNFIISEINKYKLEITGKAGITEDEFEILLNIIFENVKIIPEEDYKYFNERLIKEISDQKDMLYMAVCLACNAEGIWTHDPHLLNQKRVPTFTNINLLRFCGEARNTD